MEWWGPLPLKNYSRGRQGKAITLIVDHWFGMGTLASADSRFKNPNSGASAHFGIDRNGRVIQWVALEDTAHHAGNWNANLISIGIEHDANPDLPPTDALYAASAKLHAHLSKQYNLPLVVGSTVRPHKDFMATQCPGTLDLERIVREATLPQDYVTVEAFKAYQDNVRTTIEAIKEEVWKKSNKTHTHGAARED